jgi:uncharacterized DUF497 family protein
MNRIYKSYLTRTIIASTKTLIDITFDPAKDAINIAQHELSLADAAAFELGEAVVLVDDRFDYGEVRFRAFGRVGGEARCLVFTYRDGEVRAISYRRVHAKEMRRYE